MKISIYIINFLQSAATNGLLPILPLFAMDLGMSESLTGIYLASSFLFLFIGNILSGYLVDRAKNIKHLLIISTSLFFIFLFYHSFVAMQKQLFFATSSLWFTTGFQSVIINTIQSEKSKKNNSGTKFAKLALTSVLGLVVGGLLIGVLLKFVTIKSMFQILGLSSFLCIIASLLAPKITITKTEKINFIRYNKKLLKNKRLFLFLISGLLIGFANYILLLSISLLMKEQGYEYSEISISVAIGVLASIPFVFLFGKFSDKKGRKKYLLLSYVSCILGLLILANPISVLFFVLASMFMSIASFARNTVSLAFITDVTSTRNIGKTISYFASTIWISGIIGYSVAGLSFEYFGMKETIIISVIVGFIAISILFSTFKQKEIKI